MLSTVAVQCKVSETLLRRKYPYYKISGLNFDLQDMIRIFVYCYGNESTVRQR